MLLKYTDILLVELYETIRRSQGGEISIQFLRNQFNTQHAIGNYKKPYVALADGYCMGGVSNSLRNLPTDGYCMGGVSEHLLNL